MKGSLARKSVDTPHAHAHSGKKRLGGGAKYSKADVLYLKELFDKHDQDHNGKVTIAELIEALSAEKKLTHQELSAFRTIDINQDGVLTFNEYLRRLFPMATDKEFACMLSWANPHTAAGAHETLFEPTKEQLEEIKKMFAMFDKNGNGTIEKVELVAVAEKCGYVGSDVEDLFKAHDVDHNGSISFDEFVQLMKISYV
ncbi:hypothetical protein CHLRE_12g527450v5 [Chlamydomonas reinhardtii]|uniref:EF-hand domain-containing protein n=1 Tax=Chlamydomonas reinhardtii TaxID=3055 RepID=A8J5D7_CHLRE|nr:uncharacterized protein CHLRE_12g527450v5 [Chlamydomonas reinhardtii]PNW75462.1 hypothetical protein CHLRE_12g527450v5 [Chlamydomonas reinhardtii]|eukprot:XP_001696874.1 predicted protein [Chlamydomonas reinhardtii]